MNNNKKTGGFFFIFVLLAILVVIPSVPAAVPATGHPYMLFHDIRETPGYQYRTIAPWSGWQAGVLATADRALKYSFAGTIVNYNRVNYRGGFARDLGLAYQITKKPVYAQKAREALLNLNIGTVTVKTDQAIALGSYALAYDFVQPTLDPATDMKIRDKLATLANKVYKDLNENGASRNYVSFADYHGQAYPMVAVAGAALYDYTNPNRLPLSSTPADWHRVGTDYLFENDLLHSSGRSLFSFGFEESSGKNYLGAYKSYITDDFAIWFQVAYHTYGENLFDQYPAAKKAFTSEVWESLPNGYSNNFITNGNVKWTYHKGFISLLPDKEKGEVLNHITRIEASKILPYSSVMGGTPSGGILYCVYGNYASVPRTFPSETSHLDPASTYQVFRENWNNDADWLSLITWNKADASNRNMMHNDQLAFEYYSRGDLLLADGGEPKYTGSYGEYDVHHNTISIENPRTPFPLSTISGSRSAGIYKGSSGILTTPATVNAVIRMPWMQLLQSTARITKVSVGRTPKALTSPVRYERTIVYPNSDYFIIVDRLEGTETWTYNTIFRPSSLKITPTTDVNKDHKYSAAEIGRVNGALTIGTTPYTWQTLISKKPTATGITANTLTWKTTNPYGKSVVLDIVSSPSSSVLIEKNTGRIGGYNYRSEVYSPVVYLKSAPAKSLYRVTALLSRYSTEAAKTAKNIPVTGTGNALSVSSASGDDFIYTGKGISSFAGFSTDADTVYVRTKDGRNEFTLLNGTYLKKSDTTLVSVSSRVNYLTVKPSGTTVEFSIKCKTSAKITLNNMVAARVMRDGAVYTDWTVNQVSKTLSISVPTS
jgi:hypothetical protein